MTHYLYRNISRRTQKKRYQRIEMKRKAIKWLKKSMIVIIVVLVIAVILSYIFITKEPEPEEIEVEKDLLRSF